MVGKKLYGVIKVIDTGIGIGQKDQPSIFAEFKQISEGYDRKYEGLGLGLTISKKMMELVNQLRKNSLGYIFYEELLSPRVAETLARETGATLLKLHGIHNVSREDLAGGATYISLMEQNLKNLRTGLQCP